VVAWIFISSSLVNTAHFNGGSITWAPVDPYTNSSLVDITITQTYSWSYPKITCANDVPISTSGRSTQNDNLTCVVDCGTDGGYSTRLITILTDCISSSSSLGMMTSQRSVNVTLASDAHFSVAYQGSAWRALNSPAVSGLDWSILCGIDLRKRSDGFINTPPKVTVISPQYAIVNTLTQIKIPVSDANVGDDVRCRWSVFQPGFRRRRRRNEDEAADKYTSSKDVSEGILDSQKMVNMREKRAIKSCSHADCQSVCSKNCMCSCSICSNTNCVSSKCNDSTVCAIISTTTKTTKTSTTIVSTSSAATTTETAGTQKTTSLFPVRQAIDECGGICNPTSTPTGTTLSNCTLNFTGLIPDTWYAVSVQVRIIDIS
jgi:hypothetical protein